MRISDWSSDVCSSDLPAYLIEDESEPRSGSTTLWAGIAIVAVLAWLGGMVWLARGIFAAPPAPIELVQFLAASAAPRARPAAGGGGSGGMSNPAGPNRSEGGRGGKDGVRQCRSRLSLCS